MKTNKYILDKGEIIMLKKLLLLVGVTAMMLNVVGCGSKDDKVVESTSIYEEANTEAIELRDEIINESVSMYMDTFKELFGEDFDVNQLTYDAETDTISYEGQLISWDYVEEVTYNNMVNNF